MTWQSRSLDGVLNGVLDRVLNGLLDRVLNEVLDRVLTWQSGSEWGSRSGSENDVYLSLSLSLYSFT